MEYKNLFKQKREIFLNAVENFCNEQQKVLFDIINLNKNTKYGQKYSFEKIKTIKDFQTQVPITKYEDYKNYIELISNGEQDVLTSDKVVLLEPTGGSTSGSKYIPYTSGLKKAFNKGLEPWLSDLFLNFPEIKDNPMYWSITPSSKIEKINTKIPIGFDNDMDYLFSPFSDIIKKQIIIPNLANCSSTDEFYKLTLSSLQEKFNLGFVSIWNPTLFLNIINAEQKTCKRWKNLKVISCWDEGNSKTYAEKLQKIFPNVYIQGKGLLATEGIITIPIEGIGKLPCVQSHFFEFIDIKSNEIKLLNELVVGHEYSVLLTTQGGLYRYKIGDVVRVYSSYKDCPLLSFMRRENNISDYFGEKLNEEFVMDILKSFEIDKNAEFYMFAPYFNGKDFYYIMYYEGEDNIKNYSTSIEKCLRKNYHYSYARDLGQLGVFQIKKVKNGQKQYLENCLNHNQKLGDIKPISFSNSTNWNFETEED